MSVFRLPAKGYQRNEAVFGRKPVLFSFTSFCLSIHKWLHPVKHVHKEGSCHLVLPAMLSSTFFSSLIHAVPETICGRCQACVDHYNNLTSAWAALWLKNYKRSFIMSPFNFYIRRQAAREWIVGVDFKNCSRIVDLIKKKWQTSESIECQEK